MKAENLSASIGDVVEESSANIEVNQIPRLLFGTHAGSSGTPRSSVADALEISYILVCAINLNSSEKASQDYHGNVLSYSLE